MWNSIALYYCTGFQLYSTPPIGFNRDGLIGGMTNIQHFIGALGPGNAKYIYAGFKLGNAGAGLIALPDALVSTISIYMDILFKAMHGTGPWGWALYVIEVIYDYFVGDFVSGARMIINSIFRDGGTQIYRSSWVGRKSYSLI